MENYPDIYLVKGTGFWWYTKSMNEGFKYAEELKPDYILCLNDDIELKEDYFIKLYDIIKIEDRNVILGSSAFTKGKYPRVLATGIKRIKFGIKLVPYHKFLSEIKIDNLSGLHISQVLPGRGMIVPFNALKELNYFDEHFAQYASDYDFCLRAIKAGYKIYISWDLKIFSYVGLTSKSSSFLKKNFKVFLSQFFDKHSRLYIPLNIRYIWRHGYKIIFPITCAIFFIASFKAYFFNKKI